MSREKMTVETAEDLGLIPRVDPYRRSGMMVKEISNELYLQRLAERNRKYNVDENYMVEV